MTTKAQPYAQMSPADALSALVTVGGDPRGDAVRVTQDWASESTLVEFDDGSAVEISGSGVREPTGTWDVAIVSR